VVAIPREVIERDLSQWDETTRQSLAEHRSQRIVIVDESTVTYGSLEKLANLVHLATKAEPKLKIVVLEISMSPQDRPDQFVSMIQWSPAALIEEGGQ
jgi:hypothetical protein